MKTFKFLTEPKYNQYELKVISLIKHCHKNRNLFPECFVSFKEDGNPCKVKIVYVSHNPGLYTFHYEVCKYIDGTWFNIPHELGITLEQHNEIINTILEHEAV